MVEWLLKSIVTVNITKINNLIYARKKVACDKIGILQWNSIGKIKTKARWVIKLETNGTLRTCKNSKERIHHKRKLEWNNSEKTTVVKKIDNIT